MKTGKLTTHAKNTTLALAGLIVSALVCPVFTADGAAQTTPTNTLDSYRATYEKAAARITEDAAQGKERAILQYGKALDEILTTLKKKGDIDSYPIVSDERKRFQSEKTVPTNEPPAQFAQPVYAYRKQIQNVRDKKGQQMIALLKQYVSALDMLVKERMTNDKIEDAKAAGQEKKTAELLLGAFESLQSKAKPAPEEKVEGLAGQPGILPMPVTPPRDAIQMNQQSAIPKRITTHPVTASTGAVPAVIYITCDDAYTAWLNGEMIGRGDRWQNLDRYEVNIKQRDILSILARDNNGGRMAGLFCCITLPTLGKSLGTSRKWFCAVKEPEADWRTTTSLVGFRNMSDENVHPNVRKQAQVFKYEAGLAGSEFVWSRQQAGLIWVKKVIDFSEFGVTP